MKINTSEIRLGGWLKNTESEYWSEIFRGKEVIIDEDNISLVFEKPELFEPIPLTPDILIDCGFEKFYQQLFGTMTYSYHLEDFTYINFLLWNAHPMEHIKYLHQLQNTYFALTGKEIEYKPK